MDYIKRINDDINRRENEMNGIVDIIGGEEKKERKPKKLSEQQLFIGIKNKKKKSKRK